MAETGAIPEVSKARINDRFRRDRVVRRYQTEGRQSTLSRQPERDQRTAGIDSTAAMAPSPSSRIHSATSLWLRVRLAPLSCGVGRRPLVLGMAAGCRYFGRLAENR